MKVMTCLLRWFCYVLPGGRQAPYSLIWLILAPPQTNRVCPVV
ncbi:Uncharacterised protein [Bordetella pertussis]|nr:Uncharacterised protein [Bordetella pertussis]